MTNYHQNNDPLDALVTEELRSALQACVGRLRPIYREVIVMYYIEDEEIEDQETETDPRLLEIAEHIGITYTNAKQRLFRARDQLRKCMQNYL